MVVQLILVVVGGADDAGVNGDVTFDMATFDFALGCLYWMPSPRFQGYSKSGPSSSWPKETLREFLENQRSSNNHCDPCCILPRRLCPRNLSVVPILLVILSKYNHGRFLRYIASYP